jgi:molybdopterin-guanine dinucleotide biosynthesis protein A
MDAAKELAVRRGVELDETLLNFPWNGDPETSESGQKGWAPAEVQPGARHLWFANLNTPEDFAAAAALSGMLG